MSAVRRLVPSEPGLLASRSWRGVAQAYKNDAGYEDLVNPWRCHANLLIEAATRHLANTRSPQTNHDFSQCSFHALRRKSVVRRCVHRVRPWEALRTYWSQRVGQVHVHEAVDRGTRSAEGHGGASEEVRRVEPGPVRLRRVSRDRYGHDGQQA